MNKREIRENQATLGAYLRVAKHEHRKDKEIAKLIADEEKTGKAVLDQKIAMQEAQRANKDARGRLLDALKKFVPADIIDGATGSK